MAKDGDNIHVVPADQGGWNVKRDGASRASSHHDTQAEAVAAGRALAQTAGGELHVHGTNGRVRERASYGSDPFPPRDKK